MKASRMRLTGDSNGTPVHPAISAFEESGRWVRGTIGKRTIVDSRNVLILRPDNRLPLYCFPLQDVRMDELEKSSFTASSDQFGDLTYWNVGVGERGVENAAWSYANPSGQWRRMQDHVVFEWAAMDAWFEEAEQVFVHLRDPLHRVDVIPSTRNIKIILAGETVAESANPRLLFETDFPTRYYLPREDVRMDLLQPAEKTTQCPYKGEASYWSATIGGGVIENIAWG